MCSGYFSVFTSQRGTRTDCNIPASVLQRQSLMPAARLGPWNKALNVIPAAHELSSVAARTRCPATRLLSYPSSEVMPTTLSTAELKERIAQEVERCKLCTAEQEEAKRARDDAQEQQRLRRELENERASTASAQRFTRFFERQAADIDEDRVRVCILYTCSCCGYLTRT